MIGRDAATRELGCESRGTRKKPPAFHSQLTGSRGNAASNFSVLRQAAGQSRVERDGETKWKQTNKKAEMDKEQEKFRKRNTLWGNKSDLAKFRP